MGRVHLHLVDRDQQPLSGAIRSAIESAHEWALRQFPQIDSALLAEWAEDVGKAMSARIDAIQSPRRYAFAALHGKIREWYRSGDSREIPVGIGKSLEQWIGVDKSFQLSIDRSLLIEQLSSKLNERDRQILVLFQQDKSSPASVAAALDVSYSAAAKAIQRLKERLAAIVSGAPIDRIRNLPSSVNRKAEAAS